ncbi:hypothetical protein [Vreelandella zhaodongensis]|uniref:hypothetical protein n=1 Tax=Vreelandella zhaodongensis TaxID=1176240 RepID=UPI003EBFFA3D
MRQPRICLPCDSLLTEPSRLLLQAYAYAYAGPHNDELDLVLRWVHRHQPMSDEAERMMLAAYRDVALGLSSLGIGREFIKRLLKANDQDMLLHIGVFDER